MSSADAAQYCDGGGTGSSEKARKTVRCPKCRRRLLLSEIHCIGGELLGFRVPPHKPKVKLRKKVLRKPRGSIR